ncbi:MAG: hypothetical protein ABS898_04785 [Psychrobacillus sp.]
MLKLFVQADYQNLSTVINGYKHYGSDWDYPDIEKVEAEHNDFLLLITGMDKHLDK